jgi:hypothetical protein
MKKLLVFGCSYSDKKYVELTTKDPILKQHMNDNSGNLVDPFLFWPELLAKKLNMELVNFAQCGFGNDGIHSMFMDEIVNQKNIGLVVIMWSEFMRIGFEVEKRTGVTRSYDWFKVNINATDRNTDLRENKIEVTNVLNKYGCLSPSSMLKRSLRLFLSAQNTCENMKIPYMQVMGMPASKKVLEVEMCKSLIKSPYLDKINNDKFIGWPMFPQLDGYSFGSKLYDLDPDREKYFINSENVHPSKLGQEKITEWLYNESLDRLLPKKEDWI